MYIHGCILAISHSNANSVRRDLPPVEIERNTTGATYKISCISADSKDVISPITDMLSLLSIPLKAIKSFSPQKDWDRVDTLNIKILNPQIQTFRWRVKTKPNTLSLSSRLKNTDRLTKLQVRWKSSKYLLSNYKI